VLAFALIGVARGCLAGDRVPAAVSFSFLPGLSAAALLAAGFLTPVAGLLAGVQLALISMGLIPACGGAVFDTFMSLVFGISILLAILGSGPGAYSVDARLFGRREIIIPRRTLEPPESR
jgi:uncharacterized membrane protein YphA (DoxX/SURF4 family)